MKILSSPLRKKRSKKELKKAISSVSEMVQFRSCHKVEEQREVDLENHRLMKRLSEIGRRKSKFAILTKDE